MVLRVRPTSTRFPTNNLCSAIDKALLHSISRMCYQWGSLLSAGDVVKWTPAWLGESEDELNSHYGGPKRYICGAQLRMNVLLKGRGPVSPAVRGPNKFLVI